MSIIIHHFGTMLMTPEKRQFLDKLKSFIDASEDEAFYILSSIEKESEFYRNNKEILIKSVTISRMPHSLDFCYSPPEFKIVSYHMKLIFESSNWEKILAIE